MTPTIYAVATGSSRAAVAVVRVSGPRARVAVAGLAGHVPRPRRAALRTLRDAEGRSLDQALVLWFPGPESYTGEDCAEFHVHGGPAVVAGVLAALGANGLRLAEPGEFTRRAFERGKLDLAQAEAVADLIDAETETQRRQALEQLGGVLSAAQARWREALTEALAVFEAAVDFPDEEIPADVADRARPVLEALIVDLEAASADAERGERVREGFRIALMGAPNAGKSTLLNALAGRDAAIVMATPGTTRDVIEVPLLLAGHKVVLADTAGLREAHDAVEAEGVRRARAWASAADMRLWLVDGATNDKPKPPEELRPGDFCLITKRDQPQGEASQWAQEEGAARGLHLALVSARESAGAAGLRARLADLVAAALVGTETPTATRLRHRDLLSEAIVLLRRALQSGESPELAAEDVRLASRALDRITGRIDPEDVLDRIFMSFCIGK
jgi:tRNA modification GTPase